MKLNRASMMGLGFTLSVGLMACGGPDIDQVKADFENPSGSTTDKNSVMSASSQANASGSVRSLGASGVPGQSLTAKGKLRQFDEISIMKRYGPLIQQEYYLAKHGQQSSALRTSQFEGECGGADAQAAYEELYQELIVDAAFGGSSASADATFKMDMSTCGSGVTGTVEVTLEIEISENRFKFTVTEALENVCETEGEKACLDGTLIMEAEASGDASGTMGELSMIVAWEVDGSWTENGAPRKASVKGGVRTILGGNGMSGYGSFEYLIYAVTADGEEVSFVYQLTADWDGVGGGSGKLLIRGKDGMLECNFDATMVTCTGSTDLIWTAEEEIALSGDVYGD